MPRENKNFRRESSIARRGRPNEKFSRESSYGGVVVRNADSDPEIIVIHPKGRDTVALPKGGANPDEDPATAAAREVREEAGVHVEVGEDLGEVRYWYRRDRKLISKSVHFFLCKYISGDPSDHDHEVDEARWIPLKTAASALTFQGEREIVGRVQSKLSEAV